MCGYCGYSDDECRCNKKEVEELINFFIDQQIQLVEALKNVART